MQYNFKDLIIKDVNGEDIVFGEITLEKGLGNLIYNFSNDIDIAEIGKKIYKGESVELRQSDKEVIIGLINSDHFPFIPLVKRELIKFIGMN